MHDDTTFAVAVQLYPRFVTHFSATKSEIGLSVFMMELCELKDTSAAYNFYGGRGVIHTHLLALMVNRAVEEWNEALKKLAGEPVSLFLVPAFYLVSLLHASDIVLTVGHHHSVLYFSSALLSPCLAPYLLLLFSSVHVQMQSTKLL